MDTPVEHVTSDAECGDGDTLELNSEKESNELPENSSKQAADNKTTEVCPFVCGICSEKYDKISTYYAHLKTHECFESMQTSKKSQEKKMMKALEVQERVDENVFRCGICEIEFPSMSLLHDHMVLEENISNYHYSNVDHTARPNRLSRVEPSINSSGAKKTSNKRKPSSDGPSTRRKRERLDEVNDKDVDQSPAKTKNIQKTPTKQPAITSPTASTRSSSRPSRSAKRVDYKALAGITTIKIEPLSDEEDTPGNKGQKQINEMIDDTEDVEESENVEDGSGNEDSLSKPNRGKKSIEDKEKKAAAANKKKNKDKQEETINTEEETTDIDEGESNDVGNDIESGKYKEDGTHDSGELYRDVKTETDAYLAENDSDDDYGDDQQHDADYSLVNDLKSRDKYMKKHGFKAKQRSHIVDGKSVRNSLYPCIVCGKYLTWKALKKHSFAHINAKNVECPKCGRGYKSPRHLNDHIRSVHSMTKYRCGQCGDMLKGKQGFEKHAMLHVLRKEFNGSVDEIERLEVTEEEYENWRRSSGKREALQKITPFAVEMEQARAAKLAEINETAEVSFIEGASVELDEGLVGSSKNLDCKVCNRRFASHQMLVVHLLEHQQDKKVKCNECEGEVYFLSPEHLNKHIEAVHNLKHECEVCGERFKIWSAMWSHRGKHLMKSDPYYSEELVEKLQAEVKPRKKGSDTDLSAETTKLRKSDACSICGVMVITSRMKRHLESHMDTKEWQCDICHKFYKTRRYLVDHRKKTHFAEQATCEICGQVFKAKSYLDIHKQIHGPRDKKCPYCDKGFTTIMYLKAHLLTHQEKKQYKCEHCPAAFSHPQRLHIHMLDNHIQGKARPCKFCGDLFPSREKARKHERRVHEGIRYVKNKTRQPLFVKSDSGDQEQIYPEINPKSMISVVRPGQVNAKPKPIVYPLKPKPAIKPKTVIPLVRQPGKNLPHLIQNEAVSGEGQFIKFENGEEYKLMLEGDDGEESVEVIELSEEQHNVFIQETTEEALAAETLEITENEVEQVLEIPENAEQCQILLFPDGSFKLLNVVDNSNTAS